MSKKLDLLIEEAPTDFERARLLAISSEDASAFLIGLTLHYSFIFDQAT